MSEQAPQRRLAAILAADVVGYSRMMQADEAGTLAALKSRRTEILQPLVSKHYGRIVKVMGDGVLVEFPSAVEAVSCAAALQAAMKVANADLPEDRRISLRIGINLGDVMVEGGDLYGDGVNIAARLEGIAEPGSILISGTAYDHVRNKVRSGFDDLGTQSLKNMIEPVRVYRVTPGAAPVAPRITAGKPSIAVLPFTNMSGDQDQQYFSDGITEDIITELSRFPSLLVIARNSSFRYRDRSFDMKQIGRELGAHYLVEGSIRRRGPQLRITAQLIDATTDRHLWAEHYDRSFDDLFEVQDEVVRAVVTTLEHRIADVEAEQIQRKPPQSWAAYDYILQARQHLAEYGGYLEAEGPLRRAIELDPNLTEAYSRLAHVAMGKYWFDEDESHLDEAWSLARKALETNDLDSSAHAAMAIVSACRNRFDLTWLHSNRALELNPNNCLAATNHAAFQFSTGKYSEALATVDSVLRRDPFPHPLYWEVRGVALFHLRRYQEAIDALGVIPAPQFWERAYVIAALAHSERLEEARRKLIALKELYPDITIARVLKTDIAQGEARNHLVEGLRKAGMSPGAMEI